MTRRNSFHEEVDAAFYAEIARRNGGELPAALVAPDGTPRKLTDSPADEAYRDVWRAIAASARNSMAVSKNVDEPCIACAAKAAAAKIPPILLPSKVDGRLVAAAGGGRILAMVKAKSQSHEQRKAKLGKDPKRGYIEHEGEVGAEIESQYGYFDRDSTGDGEWVSLSGPHEGKTFDLVGIPPGKARFHSEALEKFLPSIDSHFLKSIDYVILDVRNMTPGQRATVLNYVESKHSSQVGRLILLQ